MNNKKVALVTGANQGIGYATAKRLLKEGLAVVLTSRDEKKGLEALEKLKDENCFFVQLDVKDSLSVKKAKEFVEEKFRRLDILVNNAAINYDTWQDTLSADLKEVQETFDTNLLGVWRVSQAFIPLMQKNSSGNVVNISSGAGSFESQNSSTPAYSLSKFALNGLTLQLSNQVKKDGILVNTICPGWVRTSMGGMGAPISADQAAKGIVWACLLEDKTMTGKFFRDEKIISW